MGNRPAWKGPYVAVSLLQVWTPQDRTERGINHTGSETIARLFKGNGAMITGYW